MDNIYNNESMACCVILKCLFTGSWNCASLSVLLPLLMDTATSKIVLQSPSFQEVDMNHRTILAFNKKYYDFLPLFSNAIVLLVQSELVELQNDKDYALTNQGKIISQGLSSIDSKRLQVLMYNTSALMDKLQNVSTIELYKTLKIRL